MSERITIYTCRLCPKEIRAATPFEARKKLRRHLQRSHDALEAREAVGERQLGVFT